MKIGRRLDRLRIEFDSGATLEAVLEARGWQVAFPNGDSVSTLHLLAVAHGGWELCDAASLAGAGECARGWVSTPTGEAEGEATIVTDDGRLYRVVPVVGTSGEGRWELRGWETPGAYWTARRRREEWVVEPTVAGSRLPEDPALAVLFAAALGATARDRAAAGAES